MKDEYACALAEQLRKGGHYQQAALEFERVLAATPRNQYARVRYAATRMLLASREQARHTKNALDLAALEARYQPMLAVFDNALLEDPNDVWTRCQRVEVLRCMKRHVDMADECERVIAVAPHRSWPYQRLAWAQRWLLAYDDALGSIARAIKLDPTSSAARGYRALLLGMVGSIDQAEQEFSEISRAAADDSTAWNLERGILLLFNGRPELAMPFFEASVSRADGYLAYYYMVVASAAPTPEMLHAAQSHAGAALATEARTLGEYMMAGLAAKQGRSSLASQRLFHALPGSDVVLEAALCDPATRPLMMAAPLQSVAREALAGRPQAQRVLLRDGRASA